MTLNIKIYIASTLFLFLTLLTWTNNYQSGCYMLLFGVIVLLIISHSFIELKMQERLCFKNCFFKQNSLFAKMLSSRLLVVLFYILFSIAMSLSALIVMIDLQKEIWFYIFTINLAIILFLYRWLDHLLQDSVNESYRKLLVREWSINISTLFFMLFTIYIYYYGYEPQFLVDTLKDSMINAANLVSSECIFIDTILKLHEESDALFWWVVVNGSQHIEYNPLKLAIWLIFLLFNSFALWGINRFIVQVVYILDQIFQKEKM